MDDQLKKQHRKPQSGLKADKKKKKDLKLKDAPSSSINQKGFSFNSATRAHIQRQRLVDNQYKKHHVPLINRTADELPPILIAVAGPSGVGKSTLIRDLVKFYTKQTLNDPEGPITIVSGKKRRLTFIECGSDLFSMVDMAKTADLVLLLVDAHFGFEMETFEFLNIAQIHGFPRVMGVLTHLDKFKTPKQVKTIKTDLKHRFWKELYDGAKLFYLSGLRHGKYLKNEIRNLTRYISIMKLRPLVWRNTHAYILADRVEDVTDPSLIESNPNTNRTISFFGWVRGTNLKETQNVHLFGVGDFPIQSMSLLSDPCPLPQKEKRSLGSKQKLLYAPMANVGELLYDADAVYVQVPDGEANDGEGTDMVNQLKALNRTVDESVGDGSVCLIKGAGMLRSESIAEESSSDGSDDEKSDEDSNWKEQLSANFAKQFGAKANLAAQIYGSSASEQSDTESEDDEFFAVRAPKQKEMDLDRVDTALPRSLEHELDWEDEEQRERIRDRFVTGNWDEEAEEEEEVEEEEEEEEESREQSKMDKKLKFDLEYDAEKSKDKDYYDLVKESMEEQEKANNTAFEGIDEHLRMKLEGARPGQYVRLQLTEIPAEFTLHFNAKFPVCIGALLHNESKLGFIQTKFKKHRWHTKILKNRDPLIFSIGWRRFQAVPIYSIRDANDRNRMLKYTPENMHCQAVFYGPVTSSNTGVVAFQSHSSKKASFRISATGTVMETDDSFHIVKKLKLTGTPFKIFRNTAFIKDMFNSSLEAAKFEGAALRTVSGIRGQIKKAETNNGAEGAVRARFEDKILMSDIVFCRTWTDVPLVDFYNPVTSNLLRDKEDWVGMKTVSQLRREKNIPIPIKGDSQYKPIVREEKRFTPLRIPSNLQQQLPFQSKPKLVQSRKTSLLEDRRALPDDEEEKRRLRVLAHLKTIGDDKQKKRDAANKSRIEKHQKQVDSEEAAKAVFRKSKRKMDFAKSSSSSAKRK